MDRLTRLANAQRPLYQPAVVHAPAKLNLMLRVLGCRPDGYHLLDSLMVPITLFDRIHVCARPSAHSSVVLTASGRSVPTSTDNLVVRAAALFLQRSAERAQVSVHLHKEIPVAAGLGGGSSNAAATLLALDHMFGSRIGREDLMHWAIDLGADVPFFVRGRPARVGGIGEEVEGFDDYPAWPMVVAYSGAPLSTARVYQEYDLARTLTKPTPVDMNTLSASGSASPDELLVNDLESVAIVIQPELLLLKRRLIELGARAALMTGSGSAVFGVWERREDAEAAAERMRGEGTWARAVDVLEKSPEIVEDLQKTDGR